MPIGPLLGVQVDDVVAAALGGAAMRVDRGLVAGDDLATLPRYEPGASAAQGRAQIITW